MISIAISSYGSVMTGLVYRGACLWAFLLYCLHFTQAEICVCASVPIPGQVNLLFSVALVLAAEKCPALSWAISIKAWRLDLGTTSRFFSPKVGSMDM